MREVLLERSSQAYPAIIAATFAKGFFTHNNTVLPLFSLALYNRSLYIALSYLSPFSLALHLALVSLFPFSLALHTRLYSISLSFPLFYLCPSLWLSILCSILSLSHLPHSLYFALFCLYPFSLALYTSLSFCLSPLFLARCTSLYSISVPSLSLSMRHSRTHDSA